MTDQLVTKNIFSGRSERGAMKGGLVDLKPMTLRPEPHNVCFDIRLFRPGAAYLRTLGERPLAEFLKEIGVAHGIEADILKRLERCRDRLTPELLHALGVDRWPPALAELRDGRR